MINKARVKAPKTPRTVTKYIVATSTHACYGHVLINTFNGHQLRVWKKPIAHDKPKYKHKSYKKRNAMAIIARVSDWLQLENIP